MYLQGVNLRRYASKDRSQERTLWPWLPPLSPPVRSGTFLNQPLHICFTIVFLVMLCPKPWRWVLCSFSDCFSLLAFGGYFVFFLYVIFLYVEPDCGIFANNGRSQGKDARPCVPPFPLHTQQECWEIRLNLNFFMYYFVDKYNSLCNNVQRKFLQVVSFWKYLSEVI